MFLNSERAGFGVVGSDWPVSAEKEQNPQREEHLPGGAGGAHTRRGKRRIPKTETSLLANVIFFFINLVPLAVPKLHGNK